MSQEDLNELLAPMEFDSELREVVVTISKEKYILREASGDVGVMYDNMKSSALQFGEGGNVSSIKGVADIVPLTVSRCLYYAELVPNTTDQWKATTKNVPQPVVRSWRNEVQKGLFERIKKISNFGEEAKTLEELIKERDTLNKKITDLQAGVENSAAKKGQTSTTDGSESLPTSEA